MTDRPDLTTTESDGLAIFNRGTLMWVTNETDERDALDEFEAHISSPPLRMEDYDFHYIPEGEMPEWEDATGNDHPQVSSPPS